MLFIKDFIFKFLEFVEVEMYIVWEEKIRKNGFFKLWIIIMWWIIKYIFNVIYVVDGKYINFENI